MPGDPGAAPAAAVVAAAAVEDKDAFDTSSCCCLWERETDRAPSCVQPVHVVFIESERVRDKQASRHASAGRAVSVYSPALFAANL